MRTPTTARPRWLLALLLVCPSVVAIAAPWPRSPKLDPRLGRVIQTGIVGATQRGPRRPGQAKAIVELVRPAGVAQLDALTAAGARLSYSKGRALFYDRFVPVRIDAKAAARLAALPEVARVAFAGARGPLPLDRSAQLVHLAEARGARPMLDDLTGQGVLIADVDSAVDPFHPAFFKGDGGYFDWIDVDADGKFTPGVDAIDLDRDGVAGSGEIATALIATTLDESDEAVPARAMGFDPGIDWLFLDTNGNGKRDYGADAGFDDSVPAFGEPLFVADDFDKNGKLDPGERVVRLSTSKFRAIYISLGAPMMVSEDYERGTNLSQTQVDFTGGRAFGFADALHATGVSTILVGDVPLVGRRWVGMAPDAELVTTWDTGDELPIDGAIWALGENPDVALYEMAPWTGTPLDGSDMLSEIIDMSTTMDGVTHTCPTGDQGSARKHGAASVAAGATATLPFSIPAHIPFGSGPLSYIDLSIHVRGGAAASLVLVGPNGDSHDLFGAQSGTLMSGASYYVTRETTPRNTDFIDVILYAGTGTTTPLDVGTWKLQIHASAALSIDGYVSDDQSSWALGAAWDPSVATDRATIGIPSVADHCIAVNAQPDHLETTAEPWFKFFYEVYDVPAGYADKDLAIRAYSPRGPRIDGVMKPDVTAPDNPWVATQLDAESKYAYGSYRVFGGTSGASPHVTGVAALLAQVGVRGDAARDAIRNGAQHDAITGAVPNGDYGWGRLDAAGALGVTVAGKDFTVALATDPPMPSISDDVKLVVTAQGDADATAGLQTKWDDGYDGTWDVPYAATLERAIKPAMPGRYLYKVHVLNAGGHVAEALAIVTVGPARGCSCDLAARGGGVPLGLGAALIALVLGWRRRVAQRS